MIRRTDDSHIHGHKVVILPKPIVEWAESTTPPGLASQIDGFRKRVKKVGVPAIFSCHERRANTWSCRIYSTRQWVLRTVGESANARDIKGHAQSGKPRFDRTLGEDPTIHHQHLLTQAGRRHPPCDYVDSPNWLF